MLNTLENFITARLTVQVGRGECGGEAENSEMGGERLYTVKDLGFFLGCYIFTHLVASKVLVGRGDMG